MKAVPLNGTCGETDAVSEAHTGRDPFQTAALQLRSDCCLLSSLFKGSGFRVIRAAFTSHGFRAFRV